MDTLPSYEFHDIFDRTSDYIDLKGKCTVKEIEKELAKARKKCIDLRRNASNPRDRGKLKRAAIRYRILLEHGFADRTIREARNNPKGIIGMTLRYGKADARRRILAQKRTQIRSRLRRRPYYIC